VGVFEAQAEHRLQVVRRELLKRHHRLGLLDSVEASELLRDNLGEVVVLAHPDDRDEVPVAGDGVDLGNPLDVGELGAQVGQPVTSRLDEQEGREHWPSLCLSRKADHRANCFAVRPDVHVSVLNAVMPKDRADVCAVVVAVVESLDDQDPLVDLESRGLELGRDDITALDARRHLDQLSSSSGGFLPKRGDARELVANREPADAALQPPEIPALCCDEVLKGGGDRSIRAWGRPAKLSVVERFAHAQEVEIRPPVIAARLDQGWTQNASILVLISCQGMSLDTLQARGRALALFERYGALLTDHQQEVLGLYLRSDWSLAEIAAHQGTSRAAAHDMVRRANLALQDYDRRLGLLAESARRRRAFAALDKEISGLKRRLASLEASA